MRNDGGSKLWWIALGALWGSFNRSGEEQDVSNKVYHEHNTQGSGLSSQCI